MLVIGVLGEGVLMESVCQGGMGGFFQSEGQFGLARDFRRHAGGQQKGEAAKEEGLGVRQVFCPAQGV